MPPCLDVYVWVSPERCLLALKQFIHRYVNSDEPGDARFEAFARVYLSVTGTDADRDALADLRRDGAAGDAFSLYLNARHHHAACITVTQEGAVVLGLSLDDPFDSPDVHEEGALLLRRLCREFSTSEGMTGVELPPPHNRSEWTQASETLVRLGPTSYE